MIINFNEITIKIKLMQEADRKHENMLASASVTFKSAEGDYFTISGFTVWKSKNYKGYNVTEPAGRRGFKYVLFESNLGRRVKAEIIRAYEIEKIPIVS